MFQPSFYVKNLELVIADCDQAVNLHNKYVKALDRRAKALRRQAMKIENFEIQVGHFLSSEVEKNRRI